MIKKKRGVYGMPAVNGLACRQPHILSQEANLFNLYSCQSLYASIGQTLHFVHNGQSMRGIYCKIEYLYLSGCALWREDPVMDLFPLYPEE